MLIAAIESDESKAFMLNLYQDYYGLVRKLYSLFKLVMHDVAEKEKLKDDPAYLPSKRKQSKNSTNYWMPILKSRRLTPEGSAL